MRRQSRRLRHQSCFRRRFWRTGSDAMSVRGGCDVKKLLECALERADVAKARQATQAGDRKIFRFNQFLRSSDARQSKPRGKRGPDLRSEVRREVFPLESSDLCNPI